MDVNRLSQGEKIAAGSAIALFIVMFFSWFGAPDEIEALGSAAGVDTSANATVTMCHSRTRDLAGTCARADVLVAAVGSPRLLGADAVKPGATVIDVGMNRTEDGLAGDVDFEAAVEVAGAITPVPGGVGPMTIAMLLSNTLAAARSRHG